EPEHAGKLNFYIKAVDEQLGENRGRTPFFPFFPPRFFSCGEIITVVDTKTGVRSKLKTRYPV
ncbi:MAG: hypothetical protein U9N63_05805, partial [Pseudomonadota bacterium]|nr:hypothetical protein [Pseudomonadota bacterium]